MIPFSDLVYEGTTTDGEFVRGQLFRFSNRFYICTNVPHSLEEMDAFEKKPPEVGRWYEVLSHTLRKCYDLNNHT